MNGLLCEEASNQKNKNVNYVIYCNQHYNKLGGENGSNSEPLVRRFPPFKYSNSTPTSSQSISAAAKRKSLDCDDDLGTTKKKPTTNSEKTKKSLSKNELKKVPYILKGEIANRIQDFFNRGL